MRLRQLGQGQTLMFFAPPEVHQDIAKTSSMKQTARLDGLNVIAWCLHCACYRAWISIAAARLWIISSSLYRL